MMLVLITATSFLASLLTLFSGFGLGSLLMPVVAIFFPVATAVALTAVVHLFNNLFKLAVMWRDIDWRITVVFGVPALLAAIPGAWLLTYLSQSPSLAVYEILGHEAVISPVKLTIGALLILFALIEWSGIDRKLTMPARFLSLGGVLSGFFGGLSGHQGAFRSACLLHTGMNTGEFIASNVAIAAMVDSARLLVYGLNLSALMAQREAGLIAAATLAACAGVLVGKTLIRNITIALVRRLVAVMLLLLGGLIAAGII